MTPLDEALARFLQDETHQDAYYELILNTDFYIPLSTESDHAPLEDPESVTPLVVEADGKAYLMLFDSEERLSAWAKQPTDFVVLAGFKVAEISTPHLHWAVNIGGGYAKEFVPDEISWLKAAIAE
jgi:SseB protein N-terminal domain